VLIVVVMWFRTSLNTARRPAREARALSVGHDLIHNTNSASLLGTGPEFIADLVSTLDSSGWRPDIDRSPPREPWAVVRLVLTNDHGRAFHMRLKDEYPPGKLHLLDYKKLAESSGAGTGVSRFARGQIQRPGRPTPLADLCVSHHLHGRMKRIVFKLKPSPADENKENQEWRDYPVRKYPNVPTWLHLAGFAILACGVGIGFWLGGNRGTCIGLIAGFAACFVLVMAAHPVRCPQCKGSLRTRQVKEENDFKRFFHDCPVCKISWRCEKRHWDS